MNNLQAFRYSSQPIIGLPRLTEKNYRTVWGVVQTYNALDALGIKVNAKFADWYVTVGQGKGAMVIAGCQIHYAVVCPDEPYAGRVIETRISDSLGKAYEIEREGIIWLAK